MNRLEEIRKNNSIQINLYGLMTPEYLSSWLNLNYK